MEGQLRILEVGSAEGGSLAGLSELGHQVDGFEIEAGRVAIAKKMLPANFKITLGDITQRADIDFSAPYDFIIMRDVIEHIPNKIAALQSLYDLLRPGGKAFITFPLKHSPYAGHQQTAKSWLKFIPYIASFPASLIRFLAKAAKEERQIEEILYLKKHALSYQKLQQMLNGKWAISDVDFFFSRPVYKQRFGWSIIKWPNLPVLRELANGCEIIIQKQG